MSADNSFTRISPRQSQEYRLRSTYKPAPWLNLSGSITIWEARNNVPEIDNLQHNRFYGFSASLQPRESLGLELGYDYNDVFSQILICLRHQCSVPRIKSMPRLVARAGALDLYQYVALWLLCHELVALEAPYTALGREPYRHEWLSVDSQS